MSETQFKATLELLIPLIIGEIMKIRNVNESEFIAYCLEEYKAEKGLTGKEVITLFKR